MAKRLSRKKAKNFYAAFPAGISETPEMNNILQYLFLTLVYDGYTTLGDGHVTAFIHMTCHAAFTACHA